MCICAHTYMYKSKLMKLASVLSWSHTFPLIPLCLPKGTRLAFAFDFWKRTKTVMGILKNSFKAAGGYLTWFTKLRIVYCMFILFCFYYVVAFIYQRLPLAFFLQLSIHINKYLAIVQLLNDHQKLEYLNLHQTFEF